MVKFNNKLDQKAKKVRIKRYNFDKVNDFMKVEN